jgi:hypothetical protein
LQQHQQRLGRCSSRRHMGGHTTTTEVRLCWTGWWLHQHSSGAADHCVWCCLPCRVTSLRS